MAEPSSSTSTETPTTITPAAVETNSNRSEPVNPNNQPDPPLPQQSSNPHKPNPNPNPNPATPPPASLIPPPSIQTYASTAVPPAAPSFRPATPPVLQFSTVHINPSYQTPIGVPPPGVSAVTPLPVVMPPPPASVSGVGQVGVATSVPPVIPPPPYAPPGQPIRAPYAPMPNGYPGIPQPAPQGAVPPPGILRYSSPYAPMVRPAYPPRPLGAVGVVPPLSRPPVSGIRVPVIPPVVRPAVVPSVASTEKQTTVYVGKIASTVENDFMLSLLQLCGPVKSWKRPQNPTNGTFKGFGFCEFESAEGVLRALRLLSKLNIDGQELMLNVNQATPEYLEDFVRKKVESLKYIKETETESTKMDDGVASVDRKHEDPKPSMESPKAATEDSEKGDNDTMNKENGDASSFGLITAEDRKADQEALEKLTGLLEERLKNKPLPPPPDQITADGSTNSNLEGSAKSKDGEMDADTTKDAGEDKDENEMTSESKPSGERDRSETSSPDRDKRHDRRSRERDRDLKREKERELERYEREREQERAKREKEREYRIRDDERRYKAREKEWEAREKEREHWRKREKEREKDRAQERKLEIAAQERESDDGYSKKRKYRNADDDRRRKHREKEEDLADRLKEEEEIAEAKKRAEEEQKNKQQEEEFRLLSGNELNGRDGGVLLEANNFGSKFKPTEQTSDQDLRASNYIVSGGGNVQNGISDDSVMSSLSATDARQNSNAPARKLGFGLLGSGKRTAVPSVFNQDEDEDTQKEKKMRPLVPIDYSTEEQLAIESSISEAPPSNVLAATEFARRISNINTKDERPDVEKERSRRSHDRSSQRDRDRNSDEATRSREETRKESLDRDRAREPGVDKVKAPDNQKLLDAKQLIDMIPKTKDELFSYEINWATYDKNALHERMRPWISKKITEFLGEEEPSLVDYIMSSTREHVEAAEMLNRLQGILDEEAEMFVLKMWRMLIFEIKRVETGLALRSRT